MPRNRLDTVCFKCVVWLCILRGSKIVYDELWWRRGVGDKVEVHLRSSKKRPDDLLPLDTCLMFPGGAPDSIVVFTLAQTDRSLQ